MPFVRPDSVPLPSVWHRFERITDDQKVRKFYVQDATEDMYPFIVEHMTSEFISNEPMCKSLGIINDPISIEGIKIFWREIVRTKFTIVCFEEDPDRPGKALNFVGCNVCYAAYTTEEENEKPEVSGDKWRIVYDAVIYCSTKSKKIKRPELYLGAMGLSVKTNYQGMSIGKEILEGRTGLCKACNIPITVTVFTNIASQKVAEKANFKTILEVEYDELRKVDKRFDFNTPTTKSVLVMYKDIK